MRTLLCRVYEDSLLAFDTVAAEERKDVGLGRWAFLHGTVFVCIFVEFATSGNGIFLKTDSRAKVASQALDELYLTRMRAFVSICGRLAGLM